MDFEARIKALLLADPWRLKVLQALLAADMSDSWVAAGFIRNLVWDSLTHQLPSPPNEDVDILVFNQDDLSWEYENMLEARLNAVGPDIPWSVRNQARMHNRNNDAPYENIEHAMGHWLETATGIGVKLDKAGNFNFINSYGYEDLFGLILRPTARGFEKVAELEARAQSKGWLNRWPELEFVKDNPAPPYKLGCKV